MVTLRKKFPLLLIACSGSLFPTIMFSNLEKKNLRNKGGVLVILEEDWCVVVSKKLSRYPLFVEYSL